MVLGPYINFVESSNAALPDLPFDKVLVALGFVGAIGSGKPL